MRHLHKLNSLVERKSIYLLDNAPINAFSCDIGKFYVTDETWSPSSSSSVTVKKWKRSPGDDFFLVLEDMEGVPEIDGAAMDVTGYPDAQPTGHVITEIYEDENRAYAEPWVSVTEDSTVPVKCTDNSGNVYTYIDDGVYCGTLWDGIPSPID